MQLSTDVRGGILALQEDMLSRPVHLRVESKVDHKFSPNMYERTMTILKGIVIVGKIHKHAHLNNISKGRIAVHSEFGSTIYEAPIQFISQPGTKRVVCALEDTVWTTYHPNPTNTTDLAFLEREIIASDYEALELHQERLA